MDARATLEGATTIQQLTAAIGATGALGTAAMGIVDTFKLPGGGISRCGFKFIRSAIENLTPEVQQFSGTELSRKNILRTLMSQWINGTPSADQVNIAKSLIKLRLTPDTSGQLAKVVGVNPNILLQVATKIASGQPLDSPPEGAPPPPPNQPKEADVYGRFDLLLTTFLDQAYQRADQRYRNTTKTAAVFVSVALAVFVACFTGIVDWSVALIVGLIATPLAPVAKDLATGLTSAMQALQSWKK